MASTVVAILFPNQTDSERFKSRLEHMENMVVLKIRESAIIVRDEHGNVSYQTSAPKPGTKVGAAVGGFLGLLLGSIFLVPIAGLAIGAATGALTGHATRVEVDARFQQAVNDGLRPNTSVLVLRVEEVQRDDFRDRLGTFLRAENIHGEVLYSNLSAEAEQALEAALRA
ncbi:MAG TPA: DUF1269 domain-containing protein [Chloroflexota bacterium]|jgi:uncharacterized membrane protein